MDKEQLEWLTSLLDKLPSEFKAWAIVGVLILAAIWFLRKGKEEGGNSISVIRSKKTNIALRDVNINTPPSKPEE